MTDNNINYLAKLLELKDNMPFCTYKEEARWLLENGVKNLYAEQVKTEIKHEAYKEFAERLKEKAMQKFDWNEYVEVEDIDNLVKEIVDNEKGI